MKLRPWIVLLALVVLFVGGWHLLERSKRERSAEAVTGVDVRTDGGERVELVAPDAEDRSIEDRSKEIGEARAPLESASSERSRSSAEPALGPDEALLRVRVTGRETGHAMAGVRVDLTTAHDPFRLSRPSSRSPGRSGEPLVTDERGVAEFKVRCGDALALAVFLEGSTALVEERLPALAAGETRVHDVVLPEQRDARARGRVIDVPSGLPIAGASVTLVGGPTIQTDGNGLFELTTATLRDDVARVEAAGHARAMVDLGSECEDAPEPCPVPLEPLAVLELRVTDASGAAGIGLRARVTSPWAGQGGSVARFLAFDGEKWEGTTDARGACALELPPRESLTLELLAAAEPTPLRRESLRLEPGERRVLALSIGKGAVVEGRVVDAEATPQPALDVFLLPDSSRFDFYRYDERDFERGSAFRTRSDADGRFRFEQVPPGTWWLGPGWKPGMDAEERSVGVPIEVRVVEGGSIAPIELLVWSGRCIRGRIVGPDGETPPSIECTVEARSATFSAFAHVFFGDRFLVGPLLPGSYRVQATSANGFADSEAVTAGDGEDVVLRLREGALLSGVVLDEAGHRAPRAGITVTDSSRTDWSGTDDDGAFQFRSVVPGECDLFADADGRVACLRVTVDPGVARTDLELRLGPAIPLLLRVTPPTRDLFCEVWRDGRWSGGYFLGRGPESHLLALPGSLELRLFRRTIGENVLIGTRTLVVVAGDEPVVEFTIEADGSAR